MAHWAFSPSLIVVGTAKIHSKVLIIGGGPAGSASAYWLAMRGVEVTVLEKKIFPRDKTCGDGLTPRSVAQLEAMGLSDFLATKHRYIGLRSVAFGRTLELAWPRHHDFPNYGFVVTRHDLDEAVAENSADKGANYLFGHEVTGVSLNSDSSIEHLEVKEKSSGDLMLFSADYYVVADGANSRIGRALGAARNRDEPIGLAIRGYHSSPRHDDQYIESKLDLRDEKNSVVPGYGWIFPLGDGRVNVGIGMLTNQDRWKNFNTTHALERYIEQAPSYWGLSEKTELTTPTGGKLPMGFSIDPKSGPNFVLIGDSAASINPFNGEGISYGYETGRIAADLISDAIDADDRAKLGLYVSVLDKRYGNYYRLGRRFVKLIADPRILSLSVWAGMHSEPLMKEVVKIMANLMPTEKKGVAERAIDQAIRLVDLARA